MLKRNTIRDNLIQVYAIAEKDLKLHLRFKGAVIISYISPIITILMPIIIFSQFFTLNAEFGPWNATNFLIFSFTTYHITMLRRIINEFPTQILREKYWKTLPAIIIAPFNRFNLLLGSLISNLLFVAPPFIMFLVLCYIFYPVSFITLLAVFAIFFLIAMIFGGIGLTIGVFAITNENFWRYSIFAITLIFWVSCVTYPFELFPGILQDIISLNPLYYAFDILRLTWLEDNILLTGATHSFHFTVLILFAIILPIIGVVSFNYIYKKYGIVGY